MNQIPPLRSDSKNSEEQQTNGNGPVRGDSQSSDAEAAWLSSDAENQNQNGN